MGVSVSGGGGVGRDMQRVLLENKVHDGSVVVGDWVYFDSGIAKKAVASVASNVPCSGYVVAVNGNFCNIVAEGLVVIPGLVAGAVYYLSDIVAGAMIPLPPVSAGMFVHSIGQAWTSDTFYVDIDQSILQRA